MPTPMIKWAGGKRQLLSTIKELVPKEYNVYCEPFVGGGALFLDLCPNSSIINDFNTQLVNVYKQIKYNYRKVVSELQNYQDIYNSMPSDDIRCQYYYTKRADFNRAIGDDILDENTAALFIFLNKAGFNGLYRVNQKGLFNVPPAHRDKLNTYDIDNIKEIHDLLSQCNIMCGDFEGACETLQKGDFVFFDSPYYGTFDAYQAGGFSDKDHLRLKDLYDRLTNDGVYCMLTNSNEPYIKDLYNKYNIIKIDVKRMINSDGSNRKGQEIIVTNY